MIYITYKHISIYAYMYGSRKDARADGDPAAHLQPGEGLGKNLYLCIISILPTKFPC